MIFTFKSLQEMEEQVGIGRGIDNALAKLGKFRWCRLQGKEMQLKERVAINFLIANNKLKFEKYESSKQGRSQNELPTAAVGTRFKLDLHAEHTQYFN